MFTPLPNPSPARGEGINQNVLRWFLRASATASILDRGNVNLLNCTFDNTNSEAIPASILRE